MRAPFPYESNVSLIRNILVPGSIDLLPWKQAVREWRSQDEDLSLLEYLILKDQLTVEELFRVLRAEWGITCWHVTELPGAVSETPEAAMLRQFGFVPVDTAAHPAILTGGPELSPDLRQYIGSAAKDWKWVMTSPVREGRQSRIASIGPSGSRPASWLNELLELASSLEAMDIHFERIQSALTVRTRTPSGMKSLGFREGGEADRELRRLKHWAGFSTSENSMPQDGAFSVLMGTSRQAFRASRIKTVQGESIVLRRLSEASRLKSLSALGLPPTLAKLLRDQLLNRQKMILFTGGTGSGKTTTLYALLCELEDTPLKIMTIEDPVELELQTATQSSVDEGKDWTFARAIRAYLRQDPDIIVVGEIRDEASAVAACRAALTGHGVLATLHAGSSLEALQRLKSWKIPAGQLRESLGLIVNQQLIHDPRHSTLTAKFSWTGAP